MVSEFLQKATGMASDSSPQLVCSGDVRRCGKTNGVGCWLPCPSEHLPVVASEVVATRSSFFWLLMDGRLSMVHQLNGWSFISMEAKTTDAEGPINIYFYDNELKAVHRS